MPVHTCVTWLHGQTLGGRHALVNQREVEHIQQQYSTLVYGTRVHSEVISAAQDLPSLTVNKNISVSASKSFENPSVHIPVVNIKVQHHFQTVKQHPSSSIRGQQANFLDHYGFCHTSFIPLPPRIIPTKKSLVKMHSAVLEKKSKMLKVCGRHTKHDDNRSHEHLFGAGDLKTYVGGGVYNNLFLLWV